MSRFKLFPQRLGIVIRVTIEPSSKIYLINKLLSTNIVWSLTAYKKFPPVIIDFSSKLFFLLTSVENLLHNKETNLILCVPNWLLLLEAEYLKRPK